MADALNSIADGASGRDETSKAKDLASKAVAKLLTEE